jgi:hypothetical protein
VSGIVWDATFCAVRGAYSGDERWERPNVSLPKASRLEQATPGPFETKATQESWSTDLIPPEEVNGTAQAQDNPMRHQIEGRDSERLLFWSSEPEDDDVRLSGRDAGNEGSDLGAGDWVGVARVIDQGDP